LELLSRNYREEGIRGKAAAGFKIYARTADSNRIRRALHDTGDDSRGFVCMNMTAFQREGLHPFGLHEA